jgi:MOSC domain-containing protein YiiM
LSAIGKRPVSKLANPLAVNCGVEGLEGDEHADSSVHGGKDKAVYCYPVEHYAYWKSALETQESNLLRLSHHGAFGENLTIEGLKEDQVYVGDVWEIGDVELEITTPREPCFKFNVIMGDRFAGKKMFNEGLCGWYYRVLHSGALRAGDQITVVPGPREKLIAEVFKELSNRIV